MTVLSKIMGLIGGPDAPAGPRISVFGDSHTVALLRAQQYTKRAPEYEHIYVNRLRKEKDGKTVGDVTLQEFCREIRDFSSNDFVFSAIGGNQYAILSTVRSAIEYDFLASPSDEKVRMEARLIPFRALAGFIETGVRETIGPVLREIRSFTKAKVVHLAPPPPKQDNDFIALHAEGYFTREGLQDFGPTDPALRLKCWKVQLKILSALCRELDIVLAMPPKKAVTAEGYLDPRYYANDVTHANRRYGEAVLRQILALTKTRGGAEKAK